MFCNPTEAKKAIEAGGAQADIGDIEKDMNQVSLGKMEDGGVDRTVIGCWQNQLGKMADFPPLFF